MHTHDLTHQASILVTDADLEHLNALVDHHGGADDLEAELHRAVVVPQEDIPSDVITMDSEVTYEDVATGTHRTIFLVYPRDADASANRISVLAPIGVALLGLRAGQEISWPLPTGTRRIRVTE